MLRRASQHRGDAEEGIRPKIGDAEEGITTQR